MGFRGNRWVCQRESGGSLWLAHPNLRPGVAWTSPAAPHPTLHDPDQQVGASESPFVFGDPQADIQYVQLQASHAR